MSQFMPFRGEETAPVFDRNFPSSLPRYFAQLETLFTRHGITDDLEKKTYATSFLECDLADQWEALQEFRDPTKAFSDFVSCLSNIYNLNVPRYTLFDLERLVSDRFRSGFPKLQALTEYHLQFNEISSHLLNFGLLSPREQSHLYLQAFDTLIRPKIDFRLQVKYPEHHPLLPHPLDTLFDAARWILRDPSLFPTPPVLPPAVLSTTQTPTSPNVTLNDIAKTLADVISSPKVVPANLPPITSLACPTIPKSTTVASYLGNFMLTEDNSTPLLTSNLPHSVQARIDEIEEELCGLRAQLDSPISEPTPATRSFVHLTQIVKPATFVYQNRVYQAIYLSSRARVSHIPSTLTSISTPPNPLSDVGSHSAPPIHPHQPILIPLASNRKAQITRNLSSDDHPVTFPSISRPFMHLIYQSYLPYIRNHARLKRNLPRLQI